MLIQYSRFKKNIDEWLRKQKLNFWATNTGQIAMDCPFCHKKGKLYFGMENSLGLCFVCGWKGGLIGLIHKVEGISYRDAFSVITKGIVADRSVFNEEFNFNFFEEGEGEKKLVKKVVAVEMPFRFRNFTFTQMDIARYERFYRYLIRRGITRDMVNIFKIKFDPSAHRIIFPIYHNGILVGWQGRLVLDHLISNRNPKALTAPKGYSKSDFLFNFDSVKQSEFITIVEGPIDALKTYPYNSIALFGKTLSQNHIEMIRNMPRLRRIYMALDPEEEIATSKMNYTLSSYYETWKLDIPLGTDCGDKSFTEIQHLFKNARPYDFLEIPRINLL